MQSTDPAALRNLTVVHRSDNFLVVDKPPDLIINSDDPDRDNVYLRLQKQFPDLANTSKYAVSQAKINPPGPIVILTQNSCTISFP